MREKTRGELIDDVVALQLAVIALRAQRDAARAEAGVLRALWTSVPWDALLRFAAGGRNDPLTPMDKGALDAWIATHAPQEAQRHAPAD